MDYSDIQKQEYLRLEIIEKGYDGNQFAEFLQEKKGVDVQNYTLDEIYNYVYEF